MMVTSTTEATGWAIVWIWVVRVWMVQAWVVALLWMWRGLGAAFGLPKVPDLLRAEFDSTPSAGPSLTVVVPALNEEAKVGACLESLIAQDYESLQIVAVNDRSTDGTGAVMDGLAERYPERLRVLHIRELPQGWLGKTHAMALAARESESEYLLFTDADILFRKDALRRSMGFAVSSDADHLVTVPTLLLERWDEAALLGFFQACALWAARPWKVADARAKRDAAGVGAFNLLRREAYEAVGGFEALRMEIVEDLGIARRIKRVGLKQRIAFGRGLVSLHWAAGALGVVDILTKNMFSAFGFRIPVLLMACGWLGGFCVLPAVGIAASWWLRGLLLPGLLTGLAMFVTYSATKRYSGISPWNVLLAPVAAMLLIYTLLRSMVTTLRQGGVIWRGTFYSLKELRRHVAPPMVIREATAEDVAGILAVYRAAGVEREAGFSEEEATAQFAGFRAYPSYRVFVAVVDSEVVGTYSLLIMDNLAKRGRRSAVAEDVAVTPASQGKGIGRAMMEHAMQYCRAAGCYKLTLSSNLRRGAAHDFYEAVGFERHGYSFIVAIE